MVGNLVVGKFVGIRVGVDVDGLRVGVDVVGLAGVVGGELGFTGLELGIKLGLLLGLEFGLKLGTLEG